MSEAVDLNLLRRHVEAKLDDTISNVRTDLANILDELKTVADDATVREVLDRRVRPCVKRIEWDIGTIGADTTATNTLIDQHEDGEGPTAIVFFSHLTGNASGSYARLEFNALYTLEGTEYEASIATLEHDHSTATNVISYHPRSDWYLWDKVVCRVYNASSVSQYAAVVVLLIYA